jgi:hypothetical protein
MCSAVNARYAREIKTSFPYPIAASFVRLFTDECLDPGSLRLKHILATAEAAARFLGILVLCECREHLEDKGIPAPPALGADFVQRFKRVTWGNWLHFAREGLKWLSEQEADLVVQELPGFYFQTAPAESEAARALGELLTTRNDMSHGNIQATHASEFRALCEQTYPRLETVLEALAFLLDYEVTFVSQIEVLKRRRKDPHFRHRLKRICGDSDNFAGERANLSPFLDSRSIVLRHLDDHRTLSLDPLLVYEEAAGKAPDIFFYNGMESPDAAEYAACRQGGTFRSSACERAAEIAEELQVFLTLCSREPQQQEATHGD